MAETSLTLAERLRALLDALGLPAAHFCLRAVGDLAELAQCAPENVASAIVSGAWGNPRDLSPLLERTLWIQGDSGTQAAQAAQILNQLNATVHPLPGYPDFPWSNSIADYAGEIGDAVLRFLGEQDRRAGLPPVALSGEGEVAGIRYRAAGRGTPVVLLPLHLSSAQWDPILPALQASHCTIVLGGASLIPVSMLESRADSDYGRMALDVLNLTAPQPRESLIEAGCGSGALLRRIARGWPELDVHGLDINGFLLGEAYALAAEDLAGRVTLHKGSAEQIPLPDSSFDIGFSSTMMEEGNADRMLAELVRVTKPGGRVAVIVRGASMPRWTNLPLPDALYAKITRPGGGLTEGGCADASLLQRMHAAGLKQVRGGPAWAWLQPGGRYWVVTIGSLLGLLTSQEREEWNAAFAAAESTGLPVSYAQPYFCAAGVK